MKDERIINEYSLNEKINKWIKVKRQWQMEKLLEKIACYEQFLLMSQYFQMSFTAKTKESG